MNDFDHFVLFWCQLCCYEKFDDVYYVVHWGLDFVVHCGEELVLGFVGGFGVDFVLFDQCCMGFG